MRPGDPDMIMVGHAYGPAVLRALTRIPGRKLFRSVLRVYGSLLCEIAPDTGELTHTLVLGLITDVHVRRAVLAADGQSVDPARLRPVARLGGAAYATLGDGFELARPSWKKLRERVLGMLGRSA